MIGEPLPCPYCGKPARAWLVRLVNGRFWTCRCERDPEREPPCFVPYPSTADTEKDAVAAWNAIVREERDRIDALVGHVYPLDYAWAKLGGRRHG